MENAKKQTIKNVAADLVCTYHTEELFVQNAGRPLPDRNEVIAIFKDIRPILFPGYYETDSSVHILPEVYVEYRLNDIYDRLQKQIEIALYYDEGDHQKERAAQITERFIKKLPYLQKMLLMDVQAGFDGDPAAKSKEEIIISYPGFLAITMYRLAHELYAENVPLIPRIITEYAHARTGVDINPGAAIGRFFFIDHGTGVVVGETTEIGDNVKIYQGVTLGALSTRKGQLLKGFKRHPTIHDNATIYANSTVLGGETVIGENAIVAGNTFITASIPAQTRVSTKEPELVLRQPKNKS